MHSNFTHTLFLARILFGLLCLTSASSYADVKLTFGVYTADKASDIVKQVRPVLDVLEKNLTKRLGESAKIDMKIFPTYEEGIDAIVKGDVDLSQLGPVSYVVVKERSPGISLVAMETEGGKKEFNGLIVVHKESKFTKVEELKGGKFAFGDELSTTGRYLPQQYFIHHGIKASDLSEFVYLDRHDKVAQSVASGDYPAGAINTRAFKKLSEQGLPIKILATFISPTKPWVTKSGLEEKMVKAIKESLLEITDKEALAALKQDGFTAGQDSDYDPVRVAMKENATFFDKK